jgi:hypothetical protein
MARMAHDLIHPAKARRGERIGQYNPEAVVKAGIMAGQT